jgi:hypothetical protein
MTGLTDGERKTLLDIAKRIRTYKFMQAKGYERLVKRAKDKLTRQFLAGISANEHKESEYWSQKIQQLAYDDKRSFRDSFISRRVGLMMGILGTRGFFEWVIIAEDESVTDLSTLAASIRDLAASEE